MFIHQIYTKIFNTTKNRRKFPKITGTQNRGRLNNDTRARIRIYAPARANTKRRRIMQAKHQKKYTGYIPTDTGKYRNGQNCRNAYTGQIPETENVRYQPEPPENVRNRSTGPAKTEGYYVKEGGYYVKEAGDTMLKSAEAGGYYIKEDYRITYFPILIPVTRNSKAYLIASM